MATLHVAGGGQYLTAAQYGNLDSATQKIIWNDAEQGYAAFQFLLVVTNPDNSAASNLDTSNFQFYVPFYSGATVHVRSAKEMPWHGFYMVIVTALDKEPIYN